MMKKTVKFMVAGAVASALFCTSAFADEIKVWVADNIVDFTNEQIAAFKEANPDYADWDFVVEAVGEGDAALISMALLRTRSHVWLQQAHWKRWLRRTLRLWRAQTMQALLAQLP